MNILIPDSWLREYLQTKATPEQIKEYLSLSGPSVERIRKQSGEVIYDIEITGNRPDAMSVVGVAREAAAILPRFGITAKLVNDPYATTLQGVSLKGKLTLTIKTDPRLNPRWTSIVLSGVKVGPSPSWLLKRLETTGIRTVNNVVDITNYLMRAYGQPAHAFDYDEIKGHTMTLRASKPGERLTTLDGKTHKLPGGDIVIADGDGRLIDLCGIMGGANTSIKNSTTNVVLFLQTYNPVNIRKTSMALAHRTEAAALFEKGLDPELVLPTIIKGIELMAELTGGRVASKLYDIYASPYTPHVISVSKEKLNTYIGTEIKNIAEMLRPLGFQMKKDFSVIVPSWRRDVTIDVDVIEEIARIYGYHNIQTRLPSTEPPIVLPDPTLSREEEIKTRLRDWGFTELYTYSMISEKLMDMFNLDKKKAYKIANPLSEEWVYMRPTLWPSVLTAMEQNLHHRDNLKLFELSSAYDWREKDLPYEKPILVVAWTGQKFREAKGLAEAMFSLFGIPYPITIDNPKNLDWYNDVRVQLGNYGSVGEVNDQLRTALNIQQPITILDLEIDELVKHANPVKKYIPIPKYPPVIEDFSFVVPPDFTVAAMIDVLSKVHKFVTTVVLLDAYENKRTFRVTYSDPTKTLTNIDIAPVRQKIIEYATEKFGVTASE